MFVLVKKNNKEIVDKKKKEGEGEDKKICLDEVKKRKEARAREKPEKR